MRHEHAMFLVLLWPAEARPESQHRIETGATLGYAFPGGNLERGSRTSDVTHGAALLELDGAYRFRPALSAGLAVSYGVTIPTLCESSSDCIASLGHEITVAGLVRWHVGSWRAFEPSATVAIGYEWLGTSLSSQGVTSSRGYRGGFAELAIEPMFRVSTRLVLGPAFGVRGGVFMRTSLEAPGISETRPTDGSELHFWPWLGVRAVADW